MKMKLCYQVATPDVLPAPGVTAYQGDIDAAFRRLRECGYTGAELMVANPAQVDADRIFSLSKQYELDIPMVCTGEIYGQEHLSFSALDDNIRNSAISYAKSAVDLAQALGAQINIGRLRGEYVYGASKELCRQRSVDGLREIAAYAGERSVIVALEPVNSIAINFINTTGEGISLVREIALPALKLMLDSNHMYIDDKDMLQSVFDAAGLVTYVHLVDSNRLYPGNCKLDFASFIAALRQTGYDGYYSVEVFQRPDQDTALEKSIEYLRPLLES
ncbi:MAG: sugar phosphate isomerase/epimerase [Synergistaceae bacterium]|jgi:sugar phosphate isomerase/epimerase|nr:sugar phosphate isomerase/epimerase [Synergistaceae bacterium]